MEQWRKGIVDPWRCRGHPCINNLSVSLSLGFCFSLHYWAIIAHNAPQNKKGACCACSERLLLRRERDSNPWNAKRSTVFETAPIDHSGISPKFHATTSVAAWVCGDRGIRTPEAFRLNGFQDRRYRPLSHISAAKVHKK